MSRQFIRKWDLTVGTGGQSIDLSSMRIRFSIRQNRLQSPSNADIIVTNLSPDTSKLIEKEGTTVSFSAGYEGSYGVLFQGDIIQKRSGRETPTETYLSILAAGGDRAYNFATVNKSLSSGSTFRDHVDMVLEAMKPYGITAGFIADLGQTKMARGRAFFGMARDVMRDLAQSTGCAWYIQNNKLNVVKNDEGLPGGTIQLNANTGLIGRPTQTFDGIIGRCLLNPNLRPDSLIEINQSSIDKAAFSPDYTAAVQNSMIPSVAEDGTYRVLLVDHSGDNRGQPWYSDFTCIRADGEGPLPIRLVNQGISLSPGN